MTRRLFRLVSVLALAATSGAAQSRTVHPELDGYFRAVAHRAAPLAFAVAVVQGDRVVHLGGYGSSAATPARPVTPATAFYIASSTKSFTALVALLLAERGLVDLDAPITSYAPEFTLPAPLDASRVTLRRLLSHRAGFESGPLSFRTAFTGDLPADSLLAMAARSAVAVDTGFTYTNTAFIVAARVLERVTGVAWQELVAREVAEPLGLGRTTARPDRAPPAWELARGFGPAGPLAPKPDAMMHAAGGLVMSAADAARWLLAQLNGGRVESRQVFPASVMAESHRVQARQAETVEGVTRFGYGLGWQLGRLGSDTLVHHFGNYPGAFAHVSFIPARGVGVAIFLNSEMPAYGRAATRMAERVYDLLLGRHERDAFHASFADSLAAGAARMFATFEADRGRRATRPRVPPRGWAAYAGRFEAPDMGTLVIEVLADSTAWVRLGRAVSQLEVFAGDTLRVEMPPGRGGAPAPVTFDAVGQVATIRIASRTWTRRPGAAGRVP